RDYAQLKELIEVLDPFLEATDLTQGEKTVTVSVVVPCVLSLHCHLQEIRGRVRYCGPLWLKHDVQLDSDDKDQLMTQIIDCIKAEGEKQMISTPDTAAGPEQGDVPVSPPEAPQKKLRMFSHYIKTPSSTNSRSVQAQLTAYLDLIDNQASDPCFKFWQQNKSQFPVLYRVATQIMYLEPANNNKASTGFTFFLTSCERNGLPSSNLHTFTEGFNHHPLRTEGNMTPQQLWQLGLLQNSTDEAENVEDLQELDIDWESALYCDESLQESGLVVPEFPTPINEQDMADLQAAVDPTDPSDSHGRDIYCRCLQIFQ
ncbi:Tryptophan synthase alpha chain, partial [Dissostichus eleginoides]